MIAKNNRKQEIDLPDIREDYLDLYKFLEANNLAVFNMRDDKMHEDVVRRFKSKIDDIKSINNTAQIIYSPKDIPDNYKPKIRGYARGSESWELRKVDNIESLLYLRKMGCDKLYYDNMKGINSKNEPSNLVRLFKELKTGDTLIIPDITHIFRETTSAYAFLKYIQDAEIYFQIGSYEVCNADVKIDAIRNSFIQTLFSLDITNYMAQRKILKKDTTVKSVKDTEKELKLREGLKIIYTGVFANNDIQDDIILLNHIRDKNGCYIAEQLQFKNSKAFQKLGELRDGDIVEFNAISKSYEEKNGERMVTKYKLSNLSKMKKLEY